MLSVPILCNENGYFWLHDADLCYLQLVLIDSRNDLDWSQLTGDLSRLTWDLTWTCPSSGADRLITHLTHRLLSYWPCSKNTWNPNSPATFLLKHISELHKQWYISPMFMLSAVSLPTPPCVSTSIILFYVLTTQSQLLSVYLLILFFYLKHWLLLSYLYFVSLEYLSLPTSSFLPDLCLQFARQLINGTVWKDILGHL